MILGIFVVRFQKIEPTPNFQLFCGWGTGCRCRTICNPRGDFFDYSWSTERRTEKDASRSLLSGGVPLQKGLV